jgi:hypothetical protein
MDSVMTTRRRLQNAMPDIAPQADEKGPDAEGANEADGPFSSACYSL